MLGSTPGIMACICHEALLEHDACDSVSMEQLVHTPTYCTAKYRCSLCEADNFITRLLGDVEQVIHNAYMPLPSPYACRLLIVERQKS